MHSLTLRSLLLPGAKMLKRKEEWHLDQNLYQDYISAEVTLFWTAREDTGEKRLIFARRRFTTPV